MDSQAFGLIEAATRAPGLPKPKQRQGAHAMDLSIDGLDVLVTYNLEGNYLPASEFEPAEYPAVDLVTVQIGDTIFSGPYAARWNDRLSLTLLVEERLATEGK
jgi:hypothetical protein